MKNTNNKIGLIISFFGVLFIFMHTTIPFLWFLLGIPFKYYIFNFENPPLYYLSGFTPIIGVILLTIGLIQYYKDKEVRK